MYSNQSSYTDVIGGSRIITKLLIVLVSLLLTFVFWSNVTLAAVTQSRVIQSNDDAEERVSKGVVDIASADLELITDGGKTQVVGMRFQNLAIPKGSTITNAYIEFETDETHSVPTSLQFYAQASDNAPVFTSIAFGISSRLKTTAMVPWNNLPSWATISQKHQTPNLSSIIQEVVSRTGWNQGNSLVVIVQGSGQRVAEAYDGEQPNAPLLVVEYSTGVATAACADGIDNDSDGLVDYPADPGCSSATDTDEFNAAPAVACNDGIDNDGDGWIDYPNDPQCLSATQNSENIQPTQSLTYNKTYSLKPFVSQSADNSLRDLESIAFVPMDNTIWLGDDDRNALHEMDLATGARLSVMTKDNILSGFPGTKDNSASTGGSNVGELESVAYDRVNNVMYIINTVNDKAANPQPDIATIYEMPKDLNGKFTFGRWQALPTEFNYDALVVIDAVLHTSHKNKIFTYDFNSNKVAGGAPLATALPAIAVPSGVIRGMSYDGMYLYALSSTKVVYKIHWRSKTIVNTYNVGSYFVGTRGLSIIGNQLLIGESDLNQHIKVFTEN